MANIIIRGTQYTNVNSIKVPSATQGKMALFGFMREVDDSSSEITVLDHVDTNGSAYVFLPTKLSYPTVGYRVYFKFRIDKLISTRVIWSSNYSSDSRIDQFALIGTALTPQRGSGSLTVAVNDIIEYIEENGRITLNNLTQGTTHSTTAGSGVRNIENPNAFCLFGQPNGATAKDICFIRFFEFSYAENGVDIFDLVPARDSQNVLCLYDSISDEAVYATGGTFIVGE